MSHALDYGETLSTHSAYQTGGQRVKGKKGNCIAGWEKSQTEVFFIQQGRRETGHAAALDAAPCIVHALPSGA